MQSSLFGDTSPCPAILHPHFLTRCDVDALFAELLVLPGWHQDHITIYGKTRPLPRLHRWFATSSQSYRWSDITMHPEPFTAPLQLILTRLHNEYDACFNTALGNLYRDGRDSIGWHTDDEPDLGVDPVIASVNLGATRRFLMRRKDKQDSVVRFDLTHGSLLIMPSGTQAQWEHCVPKTNQRVCQRINLTFRAIG